MSEATSGIADEEEEEEDDDDDDPNSGGGGGNQAGVKHLEVCKLNEMPLCGSNGTVSSENSVGRGCCTAQSER